MNSNKEPINNSGNNESKDLENQTINELGIYYSSVIKITDPNSGEVILHMRGDE